MNEDTPAGLWPREKCFKVSAAGRGEKKNVFVCVFLNILFFSFIGLKTNP